VGVTTRTIDAVADSPDVGRIDALARRVAVLDREVGRLRRRVRALEGDRSDDDGALLVAIAEVVGDHVFDAGELLTATTIAPHLAAALDGCTTPKQVGRRLARVARGGALRGLRLRTLDQRTARGCIWIVEIHRPSRRDGAD
jgi:hypothetical protein